MTTLEDALDRIPDRAEIIAGSCCGGPTSLLQGVSERSSGRDWRLWTGLLLDDGGVYEAVAAGQLGLATWHVTGAGRALVEQKLMDYVPLRASRLEDCIQTWDLEAALVRVTPPDRDGWCSVGPSAAYALTAIEASRFTIAEVDESLPRTHGASKVHRSALDVLVSSTTPTPIHTFAPADETARAIAQHVLGLLPDRPVLQLGIGKVTEGLVTALVDARIGELRFIGMGMDAMVDLFEHGLLAEPTGREPIIASPDLLGTRRLMEFANANPAVGVFPSRVAHAPHRLSRNERLVSVNSAIEVDLSGQVNSEVIAGHHVAGIGGSIDFVEAASHAAQGLRIIAIPSTTRDGKRSKIVASLGVDTTTTIPQGMVDVFVTEHGIARLEGKTLPQRAEALINIAAPQHREQLRRANPTAPEA